MQYNNIVVLTGAGISAESGLKTFRDNGGLWENHRMEEVATPEAFAANPELVYRFYNARRRQLIEGNVGPNAAHQALVKLENACQGNFLLVTQNVDNLHQRAGSKAMVAMHGELLKARCIQSGQVVDCEVDIDDNSRCRCCQPTQGMRPHIVWFGEMPLYMDRILDALWQADLFIAIGTSGEVYPAAGFAEQAASAGAHTVELNLQSSRGHFNEKHQGPASTLVPAYVDALLAGRSGL
ncbi:NAD-dependent protein deacylase [Aliiglaciecola sp. CAU 1673]|uniref:Sir2 family NAD+-dependent deacetylase n=1 Tax=Aliiglaciecola sp. CAU 1673 TaxID=3032595 RepID=UPI0023DA1899|nr:Sir2 family NAD+-dependent deacetylase [Aliiglaciecola sp. CAU 1673]MDF2179864.1 NAD-dependent protein deacylase [Aliiglaciecola sp. CAU 1673]